MKIDKEAVSQAQIDEWKAEYGHVYKTANGNDAIIYRPIRRSEYTQLMLDTDISEEDEEVKVPVADPSPPERENLTGSFFSYRPIASPEDQLRPSADIVALISLEPCSLGSS